ncbi:MAG: urate hydroxylase PuuD [Pseudomonadaceae bacterium]|nr:urate hydroxylase PuuD [Pseudomonadaceae bacterium]
MDPVFLDWLTLLLRFLHVITAIAWIGASLYFIWLDLSLQTPDADKLERGLGGELWAIHGGGIYEVGKYKLAPPAMPATLHWFKWEAYSTWLTGTALLIVYFYLRADVALVKIDGPLVSPSLTIVASIAYLLAGLAIYEAFVRSPLRANATAQLLGLVVLLAGASATAFELFSARAAILHVGALLATIMAANVFLGIIPSQKALVAAIEAGTPPPAERAINAKLRSTHNNYLTLPVLLCMLSNHTPLLFGHPHAWLLVVALSLTAVLARHFFNAKHRGKTQPLILVISALLFIAIAWAASQTNSTVVAPSAPVEISEIQSIVTTHCGVCHAEQPSQPGFAAPPGGYLFRTPADITAQAALVKTSLESRYMPLGNLTGMTDAERAALIQWSDITP